MPRYSFVVEASIAMITDVEADTLEDAIEIAKDREVKPLCYSCGSGAGRDWVACDIEAVVPANVKLSDLFVDGQSDIDASAAAEEMW